MIFHQTPLFGAFIIQMEEKRDHRGFFARSWCRREFEAHGLSLDFVQANISFNRSKGTLRGLHYQKEPFAEDKLVRCTRGSVFDVIIDLRPGSPSKGRWFGLELSAENHRALLVPKGFAHGFLSLRKDSEIYYLVSTYYTPAAESGVRWNDPQFKIEWPIPVSVISEKDEAWPDYQD